MQIARTIAGVKDFVRPLRQAGQRLGLVPTMGYLHDGHLELVRRARAETDVVMTSLFVNPLQFGPSEDLQRYPRDFERDRALLAEAGVSLLFAPEVAAMYPQPQLTTVDVADLTAGLCGRSRPGHFRGVATVVAKLFNILEPDVAFFGEKDAQQLAVIRRMVADLNFNVAIVGVPIVREADGLALSSRNVYLSPEERRAATILSQALATARAALVAGERDLAALRERLLSFVQQEPLARVDYLDIVSPDTLQPLATATAPDKVLMALAVWFGRTRLIDNATLEVE